LRPPFCMGLGIGLRARRAGGTTAVRAFGAMVAQSNTRGYQTNGYAETYHGANASQTPGALTHHWSFECWRRKRGRRFIHRAVAPLNLCLRRWADRALGMFDFFPARLPLKSYRIAAGYDPHLAARFVHSDGRSGSDPAPYGSPGGGTHLSQAEIFEDIFIFPIPVYLAVGVHRVGTKVHPALPVVNPVGVAAWIHRALRIAYRKRRLGNAKNRRPRQKPHCN
jgi:hypothetical protein